MNPMTSQANNPEPESSDCDARLTGIPDPSRLEPVLRGSQRLLFAGDAQSPDNLFKSISSLAQMQYLVEDLAFAGADFALTEEFTRSTGRFCGSGI